MLGDETFTTWVVTLMSPVEWLRNVVWEWGFTPQQDPLTMSPSDIQRAIANVLCPPRLFSQRGVAVSYRRSTRWQDGLNDSCLVVLYLLRPVTLEEFSSEGILATRGVEIEPAYGSLEGIRRMLETGGRGGQIVGRLHHQGLPLRANR